MLFRSLLFGPDSEQLNAEGKDVMLAGIGEDAVSADSDEALG